MIQDIKVEFEWSAFSVLCLVFYGFVLNDLRPHLVPEAQENTNIYETHAHTKQPTTQTSEFHRV